MKKKFVLILIAMISISLQAGVIDNFDRDDSNIIGNGWVETESAVDRVDVQIKDNELNFVRTGGASITTANVKQYLDGVSEVSCDMIFEQASVSAAGAARMYLSAKDANGEPITVIVRPDPSTTVQKFTVTYKGVDTWLNVDGAGDWHNYKICINDNGKTRVYVDRSEKWVSSDAGLGLATIAEIGMHRDWEWVTLKADNFMAISDLPAEAISFTDDFYRSDADDVANGWVEDGTTARINPQIKDNRLRLARGTTTGSANAIASIGRTYESAGTISADMKMGFPAGNTSNTTCKFQVSDADGTVVEAKLYPTVGVTEYQLIRVLLANTEVYSANIDNALAFHNYKFRISESGTVKFYVDNELHWQSGDGSMGQSVRTDFVLVRWWEWHYFDVDNFQAFASDQTTCYDIIQDGAQFATDFNNDCLVTLDDFATLASNWMICNDPEGVGCITNW
ncbi:MAG: hypothetical protein ACIAQZ_15795 [Sedimentisphaeraceae bacterium JB056]